MNIYKFIFVKKLFSIKCLLNRVEIKWYNIILIELMVTSQDIDLVKELENKNADIDAIRISAEVFESSFLITSEKGENWKKLGHYCLILENYKKAHECYQKALILNGTEDIELWYGIGLLYYKNNNFLYAEPSFLKVIMSNPSFFMCKKIYLKLGLIFKRFLRFENAIEYLEKCLESEDKVEALGQLGYCYYRLNQLNESFNYFKAAYLINKSPYTALCMAWFLSGSDIFTAKNYIIEGFSLCQKDTVEELDLLFLNARVLYMNKDYAEANKFFTRLLTKNTADANGWNSLGIMLAEIGDSAQALKCFIKASEILPHSPEV